MVGCGFGFEDWVWGRVNYRVNVLLPCMLRCGLGVEMCLRVSHVQRSEASPIAAARQWHWCFVTKSKPPAKDSTNIDLDKLPRKRKADVADSHEHQKNENLTNWKRNWNRFSSADMDFEWNSQDEKNIFKQNQIPNIPLDGCF